MTDTFNVIDEKWIPVTLLDGTCSELSLSEVFEKAHKVRTLAGEMPTQDASTLRFLLAVTYAVVLRQGENGEQGPVLDKADAIDRWEGYWTRGSFDAKVFSEYLEKYRDRFDLFGEDRPFYQYNIPKGTEYAAKKLVGDLDESGNKVQMFSYLSGAEKDRISPAEATRWLIHLIGYDDKSLKPVNKVPGGPKLDSSKIGWLGSLGLVNLRGQNLFETIMLNLVLTDRYGEPYLEGKAVWELDVPILTERRSIPIPRNPLELLTVPSRRVKLLASDGMVTGYIEYVGDMFFESCSSVEHMTMWEQNKEKDWVPMTPGDPSKALWRDYSSLLVKGMDRMEPGVIWWYSELAERGVVPKGGATICLTGVNYDKHQSSKVSVFNDSMSVNSSLLSSLGEDWNNRISGLLTITEKCSKNMRSFVKGILIACGEDQKSPTFWDKVDSYMAPLYPALDMPFRSWLASIDPEVSD